MRPNSFQMQGSLEPFGATEGGELAAGTETATEGREAAWSEMDLNCGFGAGATIALN